jgi:microcystin-dependent protein
MQASSDAAQHARPDGRVFAEPTGVDLYIDENPDQSLAANAISSAGGSQSHTNLQPFLCIHFIVALYGIYPSRT